MNSFLSSLLIGFFCTLVLPSPSLAMPPLDPMGFPPAPDYMSMEGWLAKPASPAAPVDVFFVYPTVLFNETDWVMDTSNPEMRIAAKGTLNTQAIVFMDYANIYAPMYRQMNLAGLALSDTEAAPLKEIIYGDVWRAFKHYIKYENHGRPFFLAGHSQGSMILANLMLEQWGSIGAEENLIAALLIGWSLTPAELGSNQKVQMCDHSDQTGCVISYNTMAKGKQSVAPTLKQGALTVNPLSWTMDGEMVSAEENLGAVFFDSMGKLTTYPHFTSAQIINSGLIVQPADLDLVTVKGSHFPAGIYHAFDYSLFFENIKANIAERIDAFSNKKME